MRSAWAALLTRLLPSPPARIVDLGCGTGSLTLLAAQLGHLVEGIDFSARMLDIARAKAEPLRDVTFALGDAADPALTANAYDVVLCRHVLWALPDPARALRRWTRLLRPRGRLVLIEGRWSTGAGLPVEETDALLAAAGMSVTIEPLDDTAYWGASISDERYAAVARLG